jgi:hypothetical protein
MNTRLWYTLCAGIFSLSLWSTADAALSFWPMEVGQIFGYTRTDGDGLTWNVEARIIEQVTIESEQYMHWHRWNYGNDGGIKDFFTRSTEDALYFSDGVNAAGEAAFSIYAPIGVAVISGDTENTRLANEFIHVPYFGQDAEGLDIYHEAYVFQQRNIDEDSPFWTDYFVPGFGFVREVDYWSDVPPTIQELVSISTVPIPAAAWLFGSALMGLVGIAKKKAA